MKKDEQYLKEFREEQNKISSKNVDYRRMIPYTTVITIMDDYLRDFKQKIAVPEQADMTVELLKDIISWEKDLSEYESLEERLRERYIIYKRV